MKILDRRINQLTKKIRFFTSYAFTSEAKKEAEKLSILIELDEVKRFPYSEMSHGVLCQLSEAALNANISLCGLSLISKSQNTEQYQQTDTL